MTQRRGPSACSGKWRGKGGHGSRYGEGEAREGERALQRLGPRRGALGFAAERGPRAPADSEMRLEPGGWVGLTRGWT